MADYVVALPPGAQNLNPKMDTFERSGKDGNEVILPLFGGDNFVGEVLGGKWVKKDDGDISGPITQLISSGQLEITGKSHSAGDSDSGWVYSKNQVLVKDGTVIDIHLKLPSHSAANNFLIQFLLSAEEPTTQPNWQQNFVRVQLYTSTSTYSIYVTKRVGNSDTTLLDYTAVTNAEGTFRLKFNENTLGYTNIYFHDGSGAVDEDEDEITDSPFALGLLSDVVYPSIQFVTSEATNRTVVSEGITVSYPFGSNVSQLVKFDLPRGTKAGVETLFSEAEDATLGAGVTTSDLDDDSGSSAVLNAQNEYVIYDFNPVGNYLSAGRYLAMTRIKDTNHVADDVLMYAYNATDSAFRNITGGNILKTAEGNFKVFEFLFDVNDADSTDRLYLIVKKSTATANSIYVDWFRIIPYDGLNGRCKCFDTMNEASESDWKEVFDTDHDFVGAYVIENGLIRVKSNSSGSGLDLFVWTGTEWIKPINYIQCYHDGLGGDFTYSILENVVSISSEKIVVNVKFYNSSETGYLRTTVTLNRGFFFFELKPFEVYPIGNFRMFMYNSSILRFGYLGDAETKAIFDFDIPASKYNTTMSDNFLLQFNEDGEKYLGIHFTNLQPTSQMGFGYGANFASATPSDIGSLVYYFGLIPFSRINSLFAEAEAEAISASARLNLDGDGEDTVTENSGKWVATQNCAVDENEGTQMSVGSACVEITSSAAGWVEADCTPAAPLGKLTKFDILKLYLHRTTGNPSTVSVRLIDADGDFVWIQQAITDSATQYEIDLPHASDDLQGWTESGTFDFTTFTSIKIYWNAVAGGEIVIVDGFHFYIGTTTSRGRGETLSGSSAVVIDEQNEYCEFRLTSVTTKIPKGRYMVIARIKDTDQVADDLSFNSYNATDDTFVNESNNWTGTLRTRPDLTSSFAYYINIFDITDDDEGDTVWFELKKISVTENTIFVDYFLIVPIGDGESWPQDLAHNAMRIVGSQRKALKKTVS